MQQYELFITANKRPETLERLLRVIRHRGFEVLTLKTELQGELVKLELKLQSPKALELLKNQLSKLYDVMQVQENTNA